MKNLNLVIAATALVALTSSCSKEPKACFTVEVNTSGKYVPSNKGKVGEMFYFNPMCSKHDFGGATAFDYGDGTKGPGTESHIYEKPGTYTVKCTIFGSEHGQKSDKSDVATQTIVVSALQADATPVKSSDQNKLQ